MGGGVRDKNKTLGGLGEKNMKGGPAKKNEGGGPAKKK